MKSQPEPGSTSKPYTAFVTKIWMPLLATFGLAMVFRGSTASQMLPLFPIAFVIPLYLTAAQIRTNGNSVQYRRLFRWKNLPYDQVVDAKWSLIPPLAYLKLKHFLPPWGKLYYLVEEENRFNFWRRRTAFMQAILNRSDHGKTETQQHGQNASNPEGPDKFSAGWVIGSACAAVLGVVVVLVQHPVRPSQVASPTLPGPLQILLHLVAYINQPLWLFIFALAAIVFVVRRRFQGVESLVGSFLIAGIAAQLVRVWVFR